MRRFVETNRGEAVRGGFGPLPEQCGIDANCLLYGVSPSQLVWSTTANHG